jgi:hypothetical protein
MVSRVTIRTCAALVLATALLAGCAEEDDETGGATDTGGTLSEAVSTQAETGAMRLTLTDDACVYDGEATVSSGSFTAEVENQTDCYGAFTVAGIAEGATIAELEDFVAESQRTWDETGTLPPPPAFYSQALRVGVGAGQSGLMPADVPAGTYALMCFVDDLPTWRGYVAGPLVVTG